MTVRVETGEGVANANSYIGVGYADSYHALRGNTAWAAATLNARRQALIRACDYIDRRFAGRFRGQHAIEDVVLKANNVLDFNGQPSNNDTVTIGSTVYRWRNAMNQAFDVLIGATLADSADNLVSAINADPAGSGTLYFAGTTAHPDVNASQDDGSDDVFVEAKVGGAAGNSIATLETSANLNWDTPTLLGGDDSARQQLEWPRINAYRNDGHLLDPIPDQLKKAQAEYALQALATSLFLQPTVDATGALITGIREKVGPLETEKTFASGGSVSVIKPFPNADSLLKELILPAGSVMRA